MKEKHQIRIRPWVYEEEKPDPVTAKQIEMMEQKNKPDYRGVYRR